MEDYVYEIRSYLPVEFDDEETNEFITYLVSAYIENLPNEKYQFSFTAYHMLYMSYIYKVKWFLKDGGNAVIEESLQDFIRQSRGSVFNTLFDLSQFAEKTSLEKLLKSLGFHVNDVDTCKNLVEVRNKCSHASGKIYLKRPQQVEHYIQEELDSITAIQRKIKPQLKLLFERFIDETWDINWIENDIKIWIIQNFLSQKDLEEILSLKPAFLKQESDNKETFFKKILYVVLVSEAVKYFDVKGEYFHKSLTILMKGVTPRIDIRRNPSDSERLKNTQEIIEEKIVPIIATLASEDGIRAQTILGLTEA